MKQLTPKQEAFCRGYMENGGNASEAYRAAYDAKEMKPATINREAAALTDNPKVTTRLAQLQRAAAERNQVSVDSLVAELEEARAKAQADSKGAAAMVSATVAKAKILGLLTDKTEVTGKDGKDLIPETDTRDLARAVLDILREARVADQPEADPEIEQTLLPAPSISAAVPESDIEPDEADDIEPVESAPIPEQPRPRPSTPRAGEREIFDNGAEIMFVEEFQKYGIYDAGGRLHGYRRDLEAARVLASGIKGPPLERAPRAAEPVAEVPDVIPRDCRPFPAHRPPRVLLTPPRR